VYSVHTIETAPNERTVYDVLVLHDTINCELSVSAAELRLYHQRTCHSKLHYSQQSTPQSASAICCFNEILLKLLYIQQRRHDSEQAKQLNLEISDDNRLRNSSSLLMSKFHYFPLAQNLLKPGLRQALRSRTSSRLVGDKKVKPARSISTGCPAGCLACLIKVTQKVSDWF